MISRILLYLAIGGASIVLFFPLFMVLTIAFTETVAAIIALAMMYIGLPLLFLRASLGPWEHSYRQVLDWIVYLCLLGLFLWTGYQSVRWGPGEGRLWAMLFELLYGWIYYRLTGSELFGATRPTADDPASGQGDPER